MYFGAKEMEGSKNAFLHACADFMLNGGDVSPSTLFHFSPSLDHGVNGFLQQADHVDLLGGNLLPAIASRPPCETLKTAAAVGGFNQTLFPSKTNCSFLVDVGRKRSAKKDRHGKIFTAHGPRDRRMRLSLEIARKFFDLQDMLGYDKASKTVEWLMNKSKPAIKELAWGLSKDNESCNGREGVVAMNFSSISDSKIISGFYETSFSADRPQEISNDKSESVDPKQKKIRPARKITSLSHARELRASRRARARERTREKMCGRKLQKLKNWPQVCSHDQELAFHSNPNKNSDIEFLTEVEEPSSLTLERHGSITEMVSESVQISRHEPAPPPTFDYHHQHIPISRGVNSDDLVSLHTNDEFDFFQQNWDINDTETSSSFCNVPNIHSSTDSSHERASCQLLRTFQDIRQQSQLLDAQFSLKSWDGYC